MGDLVGGLDRCFRLREHDAGVIEEDPACGGELNTFGSSDKKLSAYFLFEIADLAAEGWLRDVQFLFCRELEAAGVGDGDEVSKMSELHPVPLLRKHNR